uniref:Fatty acid desaturase domain-containing protein n=1 Tax=Chromera velia CCMP2878 TaxID=1169474 RepID=A0A0G4H2I8_9ALVE|eukprot:Cvel_5573.t1-p1 / transcript=Cvel_5573.t1 / gene=Cvel_5573 / organism=Chromera_velia_CCMP2878 / gene_product=hypothetical protein / transcript_product=hypothetical protein / location=Cvel_scaffold262:4574-8056(+) / protein_length=502 / sequence_SO=supercontig / SO=protein_coding / is_pseudo=false
MTSVADVPSERISQQPAVVSREESKTMTQREEATDASTLSYKEQAMQKYRARVPVNTDIHGAVRNERAFPMPAFIKPYLLSIMEDPRDYMALELLMNVVVAVVPTLVLLFFFESHLLGAALLVFRMYGFHTRFMLTLHAVSHRRLFKKEYHWLNLLAENGIGWVMGIPPGTYYLHHVAMHHAENNVFPTDITSTMPYDRSSPWSLIHYVTTFYTKSIFYLPYYAWRKGRYDLLVQSLVMQGGYHMFVLTMTFFDFKPIFTMWTCTFPLLVVGASIMSGNFSQHIFIDPQDPDGKYGNSFCFIQDPYNQKCYNDGYHTVHHAHSRLHWSEMPTHFEENIEKFAKHDVFVLTGIENKGIMWYSFTRNWAKLYEHYVQIRPGKDRSLEEFAEECERRTKQYDTDHCLPKEHWALPLCFFGALIPVLLSLLFFGLTPMFVGAAFGFFGNSYVMLTSLCTPKTLKDQKAPKWVGKEEAQAAGSEGERETAEPSSDEESDSEQHKKKA